MFVVTLRHIGCYDYVLWKEKEKINLGKNSKMVIAR